MLQGKSKCWIQRRGAYRSRSSDNMSHNSTDEGKKQTVKHLRRLKSSFVLVKHDKITFICLYFRLDRTRTQLLKSPVYSRNVSKLNVIVLSQIRFTKFSEISQCVTKVDECWRDSENETREICRIFGVIATWVTHNSSSSLKTDTRL
jgi:hypothetical protein